MQSAVRFAVGLLLILLGNDLPKLTRNFFVGIRTPAPSPTTKSGCVRTAWAAKLLVSAGFVVAIAS